MKKHSEQAVVATIGMDLGDQQSRVCVLDDAGEIVHEGSVATSANALARKFEGLDRHRIVIETGAHANWVHDLLASFGHEVVVANARKVHAISANERKCDELDARMLARLGRTDIRLLQPVGVRPEQIRRDMMLIRAREALVKMRTSLVNSARGLAKSMGERLPSGSAKSLHKKELKILELRPMWSTLERLNEQIDAYDKQIKEVSAKRYAQTALVRQVTGVGPITSLYFVLMLGDVRRFKDGRAVGAYVGLVSRRDQSGSRDPQLSITKCGDELGRRLLVQCAQYILGPYGPDTDLRRFGLRLAGGSKRNKKRAIVATARKLAVLLFALLRNGEMYEPLRNSAKSPCRTEAVPDGRPPISRPPRTQLT